MKRSLLLTVAVCLILTGFSQQSRVSIPESKQNLGIPAPIHIKDLGLLLKPQNDFTVPKAAMEAQLGTTVYDLQTNTAIENRFYIYPGDSTMYGTWTRGMNSAGSFPERGTGYNQYDGTTWGPAPTTRIENERCGWPSYAPLGPTGEIVITHTDVAGLKICTRAVKGTGTWTQSILAGPAGAVDISWPRVITTGPDHNVVHLITLTYQVYQGLDLALLYYRSLDGGLTWDIQNEILPGMDVSNGLGFGGDDYAWGSPKGDSIYFLVNGQWSDAFIMASYDAGTSWNKIPVFNNGYKMNPTGTATNVFATTDGSGCVEMDKEGVFHVVMGRIRAADDGSQHVYYPYTDGLIYWNSTMPLLNDSLNLDTLDAHGQLLGYVASNANNDPIVRIPYYGVSMSSFPQITIDDNDAIFVIWSGITVGNPFVGSDSLNYRHIWFRKSFDHGVTWTQMEDFNKGLAYIYREFVFPSMAKYSDAQIHYIYQSADVPGSCIKDAAHVSFHTNTIEYRAVDKINVGIDDHYNLIGNTVSDVYPNPVKSIAMIDIDLVKGSDVTLDIFNPVGQKVMSVNKGFIAAGSSVIRINVDNLKPGVYFCTVRMNNTVVSKKMIVE